MDTDLIEINPLVITKGVRSWRSMGRWHSMTTRFFRHPDVAEMRDETEEDPAELAQRGGAQLHQAGWDDRMSGQWGRPGDGDHGHHQACRGEPANFLDVGGGADEQQVTTAFQIITKDPAVKGIFVNIFGGIMRCDVIAAGIVAAVKNVGLGVPLVVRLEGTNVEEGKQILRESGFDLVAADSLKDGAEKIVGLTR